VSIPVEMCPYQSRSNKRNGEYGVPNEINGHTYYQRSVDGISGVYIVGEEFQNGMMKSTQ